MREPGRPAGRRRRPSVRPSSWTDGGAERHARAGPGRPPAGRPAAAADRPLAAAVDHPLGAFCQQVDPMSIFSFWSSGGQYGSLGADFLAERPRGVRRATGVF